MRSLMFKVVCCCCWSLSKSRTVSESVSKDGKRRVFFDQRVHVNPSMFEHVHLNKGALGRVHLNKGSPGREHLNKGAHAQLYPNKASPGRVQTKRSIFSQMATDYYGKKDESRGESSRGRSICKCGVGRRLGVKEIQERKRLLRHMMVDRCPLSSSLPTCFFCLTRRSRIDVRVVGELGPGQLGPRQLGPT